MKNLHSISISRRSKEFRSDMKTKSLYVLAVLMGILAAIPVFAHHSFSAEFDSTKVVTLTGTVTKVEWANPHARIYLDVKDDKGMIVNWDFEMGSPNGLMRLGWRRESPETWDAMTVDGTLRKH